MKRFAIFGASGFGREVLPVLRHQLGSEPEPWDLVFVDDNPPAPAINGQRVLSFEQWIAETATSRHMALAIANSEVRAHVAKRCLGNGVQFTHVQADNVVVYDEVEIGEGAILSAFVTLTSNVRIGRHFHANIYSYVAHDCVIGDFVTFAPAVKCNGNVVVEDHAYIGTGAILRQGKMGEPLVVGRGAVVGMGAVVTKNVPPGITVIGNPARPMESRGN